MSQWAAIVDPDTGAELPDEHVGEIWLHGDNIGRGYWARPEETEYTFGNKLQSRLDSGSHAEGAKADATWLRTGDLGCYIDGDLYITGRIKDMVIVDGANHYPQDIEATVADAFRRDPPRLRRGVLGPRNLERGTGDRRRARRQIRGRSRARSSRRSGPRYRDSTRCASPMQDGRRRGHPPPPRASWPEMLAAQSI